MEEPLLYYTIYLHEYKDNLCNHKELPFSFYVGFPLFLDKSRNTNTAILAKKVKQQLHSFTECISLFFTSFDFFWTTKTTINEKYNEALYILKNICEVKDFLYS